MFQKTKLVFESVRDGLRRAQFFGTFREPKDLIQAKAELQKDIHLLERALALPEPRRPFGDKPAARITSILNQHGDALGDYLIAEAHRVLQDRNNWNESEVRPLPLDASGKTEVEKFLASRRSVRAFGSDRRPTEAELNDIIELGMQAPSVSNTQSWNVRAYQKLQDISALLELQDGNVGNSPVPTLLLVSVDIRSFTGANERNQMWIDGGIFLQQLLLSIHAKGWASCPMNFSSTNSQANQLRKLAQIPEHEEIICFVSMGQEDPSIAPARSSRKQASQVLIISELVD